MEHPTGNPARETRDPTTQHLRDCAAARVEQTSLRGVAREIGMSPTGLKKFLLGTSPYSPTVRKLRKWFVQHGATPAPELSYNEASAALSLLTHDLPAGGPRREAADCVLDCLGRGYDASGRARPRWVAELKAEMGKQAA